MKLYYHPISGYSIKVLIALAEKDIEFERSVVNLMDPVEKQKYNDIYPIGKVPLVELDDGHKIPESTIIIEYLDQHHDLGLFFKDPELCRKARFYDRMSDLYIHNQIGTVFFDGLKPADQKNPDAVQEAKRLLDYSYEKFDSVLDGKDYVVGGQYSIADLSLFAALFHAPHTYPFEQFKNITNFRARIMERPATQKAMQEIEPALNAFKDMMK